MSDAKRNHINAMKQAADENNIDELKSLISTYPQSKRKGRWMSVEHAIGFSLKSAIECNGADDADTIKYLADLATPSQLEEAFCVTATYENLDIMQLLFDKGARDTNKAAHAAAEEGHLSSIQKLYELKPPINPNEIITIADLKGFTDIVEWIKKEHQVK